MKRVSSPPSEDNNNSSIKSCGSKRHKAFENLINLLECCVWQGRLRPDDSFHSCENSHLLCYDCELQLKLTHGNFAFKCPVCRVTFKRCKQSFVKAYLEAEYEDKKIVCRGDKCIFTGHWRDILGHRGVCFHQVVWCPGYLTRVQSAR